MLTAKHETESRIEGLQPAPTTISPSIRAARIVAAHRQHPQARAALATPPVESVRFGKFVFHIGRAELRKGDEIIRLTDREREMLRVLAATPGETVSRLRSPELAARLASARSTCRSTGYAAKSSAVRPIRCLCRPCAASATAGSVT